MFSFNDYLEQSKDYAESLGHDIVTIDHLFIVAMKTPSIQKMFESIGVDYLILSEHINKFLQNIEVPDLSSIMGDKKNINSAMVKAIENDLKKKAIIAQLKSQSHEIEPYFIIYECMSYNGTGIGASFDHMGHDIIEVIEKITDYVGEQYDINIHGAVFDHKEDDEDGSEVHDRKAFTSNQSNKQFDIAKYTDDLITMAMDGKLGKLVGRETELHNLTQILSRKKKKNPILVGESGTGKTEIVNGLANAIVEGKVPENMKDVRILSLNVGALTAGTRFRGDFEERVDQLLKYLKKTEDNIILFVDEIHMMMGAGSSDSSTSMSNMLKPALSDGSIRIIGATTVEEYRSKVESDSAISRRFMKIDVKEPTALETLKIVKGVKREYEKYHNVKFSDDAIDAIIKYSSMYLQNKKFPDKAIDLMDASGARNNVASKPVDCITKAEIALEVSYSANLPMELILCEESDRMRDLKPNLEKRVFGQEDAINTLVSSVMIARAGLREHNSIQGAFLFVGSSGTGKTELSKALADSMGMTMVRFDMSEFSQEHTVAKLIGSPPGYIGHDKSNGMLLEKIESHPNCILLLDEIEKAHPDVLLPLLQAMDEGHLTGSQGKTVYFNNVTLIMTTNLGTKNQSVRAIGYNNKGDDGIDTAIKAHLRPEFLNRIDAIVRFNNLQNDVLLSIVDKNLSALNDSLSDKKIKVTLSKKAKNWLVENGTEEGMGARPMKRCFAKNIKEVLAPELLYGKLSDGSHTKVKIDVQDDALTFEYK